MCRLLFASYRMEYAGGDRQKTELTHASKGEAPIQIHRQA